MSASKIEDAALLSGFIRARAAALLPPDAAVFKAKGVLLCALPYGLGETDAPFSPSAEKKELWKEFLPLAGEAEDDCCEIAPFARFNYYREAAARLKKIAGFLRENINSKKDGLNFLKKDFRVFCNSRFKEKEAASRYGLASIGRNGLLVTKEAGCLFAFAGLTLPFAPQGAASFGFGEDAPPPFYFCKKCPPVNAPCVKACPSGALLGDGSIILEKCAQWYASGAKAGPPLEVRRVWGKRLYGCGLCQKACIRNKKALSAKTSLGPLPAKIKSAAILKAPPEKIKELFKGTAMGLSWLSPETIKRSASLSMEKF